MKNNTHLSLTADIADSAATFVHPWRQIEFIESMWKFVGGAYFANSLVYSTPKSNTGWTAFRGGENGRIAYHHWDRAAPSLLQLDVVGPSGMDTMRLVQTLRNACGVTGLRLLQLVPEARAKMTLPTTVCDDLRRRPTSGFGLGPGRHLELEVRWSCNSNWSSFSKGRLDLALMELVELLGMISMTSVQSAIVVSSRGGRYMAFVGITTSHVWLDVMEAAAGCVIELEIFSCKDFEPSVVKSWQLKHFGSVLDASAILLDRHPNHFEALLDF